MSPRDHILMDMRRDIAAGLTDEQVDANAAMLYERETERMSPAKRWFHAPTDRAPVYRALRLDPADPAAPYAVLPFRLAKNDEDQWRIFAAWPCPLTFCPAGEDNWTGDDWLGIEHVISWDPNRDTAELVGDSDSMLVGTLDEADKANTIYASPRTFFQGWAIRRAQYLTTRQTTAAHWSVPPRERDEVPGALLIGDLDKIRLRTADLPAHIETQGIDPKALNRAIIRAAQLPRVTAQPTGLRRAA